MSKEGENMNIVRCNNCNSENNSVLTHTKNVGTSGKKFLTVVICNECGLCFLNPQPTEQSYEDYYKSYGRKNRGKEALIKEKRNQKSYIDLIEKYSSKDDKVLDVGCGKGIFLHFLRERGFRNLSGIDLSQDEIRFAKEELNLTIENKTVENYKGKDFDILVLNAVIEHYTDPKASLTMARDTLKEGGLLFISTPNVKKMTLRKGVSNYFKFAHTYYFSMITLKSIVQQAGFEIIDERVTKVEGRKSYIWPRHYRDSELLLVARKITGRGDVLKGDYRDTVKIFKEAKKRDFPYFAVFKLDRVKGFGFLFKKLRQAIEPKQIKSSSVQKEQKEL